MSVHPALLPECAGAEDTFSVVIDSALVVPSQRAVITALGYAQGSADQFFTDSIDGIRGRLPQYLDIQAGYRLVPFTWNMAIFDGVAVEGVFFKLQKIVASQVRNAEVAALFACTIGSGLETLAKERAAVGEVLESHFIDTVASLTAEMVATLLHDHIAAVAERKGWGVTNRYSPGYCGWSVADQQKLFSLLPKGFLGISLSSSSLMHPVKSVSGIVGMGKKAVYAPYLCGTCGQEKCTYRGYKSSQ